MQTLGNVETKLLYTLHWILLDASDECMEADYESGIFYSNPFHYLFSVPAMTVSLGLKLKRILKNLFLDLIQGVVIL